MYETAPTSSQTLLIKIHRISGYVSQASIQVVILEELALRLKNDTLIPNTTLPANFKTVLLGHSYGSVLTEVAIGTNPSIADAAIITGCKSALLSAFNFQYFLAY